MILGNIYDKFGSNLLHGILLVYIITCLMIKKVKFYRYISLVMSFKPYHVKYRFLKYIVICTLEVVSYSSNQYNTEVGYDSTMDPHLSGLVTSRSDYQDWVMTRGFRLKCAFYYSI